MQPTESQPDDAMGQDESVDELTTAEILGWLEFACWTMLALAPILYYVNGPSVSPDQFVVRTALIVLSATGAIVLRWVNWRRRKRKESGLE